MKCTNCGQHYIITVNRDYDVPYTGGYNYDGTVIYIDRKLPTSFVDTQKQEVNAISYLVIHEVVEKVLMDHLGFSYNQAHSIAMGAEMHACTMDRVNYDEYYSFLGDHVKEDIKPQDFNDVPPDLDITPYVEDGLTDVVEKIRQLQRGIHNEPV